jgi:F0F1-type ATP synthase assembly protein I
MITCPNCQHKFSLQDALCEDWRDENKKLDCPSCKRFLRARKDLQRYMEQPPNRLRRNIIALAVGLIIGIVIKSNTTLQNYAPIQPLFLLLLLLVALYAALKIYRYLKLRKGNPYEIVTSKKTIVSHGIK